MCTHTHARACTCTRTHTCTHTCTQHTRIDESTYPIANAMCALEPRRRLRAWATTSSRRVPQQRTASPGAARTPRCCWTTAATLVRAGAGLPLLPWCTREVGLGWRWSAALCGCYSIWHVPCPRAGLPSSQRRGPAWAFAHSCVNPLPMALSILAPILLCTAAAAAACVCVCVCVSICARACVCVCVCARVCVCNPPYLVGELHAPWRLCQEPEVLRQLRGSTGVRGFRAAQKPFSCNEDSGTTLTMHATHLLCNGPFQCVLVQGNGKGRPQNTARTWIWAQTTACIGAEHNLLCLHVCWRACRGSGGAGHKLPAASDAVLAEDIQYDARAGGCRRLAASRLAAVLKMAAVPGMGTREGSQCQGWQ